MGMEVDEDAKVVVGTKVVEDNEAAVRMGEVEDGKAAVRTEDVEDGKAAGRVEAVEETARPRRAWDDETSAIFVGSTLGLVATTMVTVEREAFCLLVVTAGGTFDLLAATMGVSEVGKLWMGSNIRARRMLISASMRSLGLNPVDRLSLGLVEGVSWAVTY